MARSRPLFHREPRAERDFARVAHRHGLAPFLPRPLPRPPMLGAGNRRIGGALALAAEVWLRLGRPVETGQALYRDARWADRTTYDLEALAREGNLGVLPFDPLEPFDRRRVRAEGTSPSKLPACSPNTWRRTTLRAPKNPGGPPMHRRFRPELLLLLSLLAALPAAASWEVNGNATSADFHAFSERFSSDAYFYPRHGAAPLGLLGFEAYADATYDRSFDDQSFNTTAVKGSYPGGFLSIARVGARKGLPGGFDIGASYGEALGGDIKLVSAELQYAIAKAASSRPPSRCG